LIVEGRALERFLNMAVSRRVKFWDVSYLSKDRIILKVRLGAVGSLRHIARRTACRFRVRERTGLPFLMWRVRRRKALYGGALLFFVNVCFLSSFVWTVEVNGTIHTDPAAIRETASVAGLRIGTPRWRVRERDIEQAIREQFPGLAWVGVDVKGSKAQIKVVEKKLPDAVSDSPAHVVAGKAGLVKELLVLSGQPVVREGDTVSPGQILISGEIVPGGEGESGVVPGSPRYTRARGIVRARVWYQGYGEAPLLERGERTGKTTRSVTVVIGNHRLRIIGPSHSPYPCFRTTMEVKTPVQWRSFRAPVEIITTGYTELIPFEIRRSQSEARRLAEKQARDLVRSLRPEQGLVVREDVEEIRTGRPEGIVRVRLRVELLEDIGVVKQFKP
jgi:similar to stage IV sporulation protein